MEVETELRSRRTKRMKEEEESVGAYEKEKAGVNKKRGRDGMRKWWRIGESTYTKIESGRMR